mgnify:CR=1 FL=1
MIRFRPDAKQVCVFVLAAALALVSLMVPLDDGSKAGRDDGAPASERLGLARS